MSKASYRIIDNGDSAISILFSDAVSEALTRKIMQLVQNIKKALSDVVVELIPGYQSLTLYYQPLLMTESELKNKLISLLEAPLPAVEYEPKLTEIPVCYQNKYALDLISLARHCGLSVEEVIHRHTQPTYLVHTLGFLPGFLYLGGLDARLVCPRKNTPTIKVPAGSVAIGEDKTGIYPLASPGGWHIIGRTPLKLFRPDEQQSFIASPLDRIRFVAISEHEYQALERRIV